MTLDQTMRLKPKTALTEKEANAVKEAELDICVFGYQSFHSLESEGIRRFAQTFVDLGAKRGQFSVSIGDCTLFGRNAIQNLCLKKAEMAKEKIREGLSEPTAASAVALTTDIWTDGHRNLSYLDVHAFWITKDFKMKHCLLSVEHFGEEPHTAENVLLKYESITEQYSLTDSSVPVVTDKGSNMVSGKLKKISPPSQLSSLSNQTFFFRSAQ